MAVKNSIVLLFTVFDGILSTSGWKIKPFSYCSRRVLHFHGLCYLILVSYTAWESILKYHFPLQEHLVCRHFMQSFNLGQHLKTGPFCGVFLQREQKFICGHTQQRFFKENTCFL